MKKLFIFAVALFPLLVDAQTTDVSRIADPNPGPTLTLIPVSISGMVSQAGSLGTPVGYSLNWFNWSASADTITASSGFLVSVDGINYLSSLIVNTPGATGTIPVSAALSGSNTVGPYTGTIHHQSGSISIDLPVSGNTNGVPTMNVSPSSISLTDTVGSPGSPKTLTTTFASLSGSVNVTIPTATIPIELSQDGINWFSSLSFNSGSPWPIQARITSSASQGTAVDTIQFSAPGVPTVKIPVNCTVSNPSSVHYRAITIPSTAVASTISGFPMVINETQTYLKTVANGGSVQNANAYDVTFSRDIAGTSLLKWDVEYYNPATGQLVVWVKMDSISSFGTTTIYMRYNQPSITTFQGGAVGSVYDANYVVRSHFSDVLTAAGQTVKDVTANGNNFTSFGTWTSTQSVAGQLGQGLKALHANSDYLQWATSGTGGQAGDFTFEFWSNLTVADNTSFTWGAASFGNNINWFSATARLFDGGSDHIVDATTTPTGSWQHFVFTRSGTTVSIYRNGALAASATKGAFTFNFQNFWLNQSNTTSDMTADEPSISNIARSAVWIATEYANQHPASSATNIYTIGIEH